MVQTDRGPPVSKYKEEPVDDPVSTRLVHFLSCRNPGCRLHWSYTCVSLAFFPYFNIISIISGTFLFFLLILPSCHELHTGARRRASHYRGAAYSTIHPGLKFALMQLCKHQEQLSMTRLEAGN